MAKLWEKNYRLDADCVASMATPRRLSIEVFSQGSGERVDDLEPAVAFEVRDITSIERIDAVAMKRDSEQKIEGLPGREQRL